MGDCWNVDGFEKSKNSIMECNKRVGNIFKSAYRYIGAAKMIHDNLSFMYSTAVNWNQINKIKYDLSNKLFISEISNTGIDRHMFATAFTPNGIITYIENLVENIDNIYVLEGNSGTGRSEILDHIYKEALGHGHYIEVFHTPLKPEELEHLIIPELNTAILTKNEITDINITGEVIDLNSILSPSINDYSEKIFDANQQFKDLLNYGLSYIKEAKSNHDLLETYYIPNMNFNKMDEIYDNIIKRIEQYEK